MSIPPAIVKIPGERFDQLKRLAEVHNLTLADTIGLLINQEIEAGRLDDELTGLKAGPAKGGKIKITILGIGDRFFSRGIALGLADSLERAADRKRQTAILDLDAGMEVIGIGPAVRLKSSEPEGTRVLAPSIARDFARQIRKAAKVE